MPKLKYEELKTVDDLIAELNAIKKEHGNVPLGVIGHFGEIYPFSFKDDGYFRATGAYQVPMLKSWRSAARKETPVFSVEAFNIGESPD